ncbi:hypothetical protein FIBSPDRAFT_569109 [Athelia psychrophila]|uniref:Uncharacterized protein n=1 Tax=Athelia psychrophila TaxID=1759441 RepID=A0A166HX14_9AGAM|nr:hypothetical protein FIBSPDRAFT_569109 [Fibularhizoctonia sp. CBS 109695]
MSARITRTRDRARQTTRASAATPPRPLTLILALGRLRAAAPRCPCPFRNPSPNSNAMIFDIRTTPVVSASECSWTRPTTANPFDAAIFGSSFFKSYLLLESRYDVADLEEGASLP